MSNREDTEKNIKKFSQLDALSNSEGGKVLIEALLKDIKSIIESVAYSNPKQTIEEYIALTCALREKLAMYNVLKNAKKNAELEMETLKEILDKEE